MKWIKCSDRLPELRQEVLVYTNKQIQTSYLDIYLDFRAYESLKRNNLSEWYRTVNSVDDVIKHGFEAGWSFEASFENVDDIEYWMPFPEPPEEDVKAI